MLSEEELVNSAFEILGSLLVTSENACGEAVNLLMHKHGIDADIAGEAVAIALERWTEVYDLE
jgi:hypothetical protein